MDLILLSIALALIEGIVFAAYDVFNKRNIPEKVAYAAIIISAVVGSITYSKHLVLVWSIALAIFAAGYVLYRKALLGLGDVIEFVSLSLLVPFFEVYYPPVIERLIYSAFPTFPFVIDVFFNSGIFAVILVAVYFAFLFKKSKLKLEANDKKIKAMSAFVLLSYIALVILLYKNLSLIGVIGVLALGASTSLLVLLSPHYQNVITSEVSVKDLVVGDIIEPMPEKGIKSRLVTQELIKLLKQKKIKRIKVYSNLPPFSVFILIGFIIALLFGNVLFWFVNFP